MQIYTKFIHINPLQFSTTPIEIPKLPPIDKDEIISDSSRTLYQTKVGLLLFVAIATRLNIAFVVS